MIHSAGFRKVEYVPRLQVLQPEVLMHNTVRRENGIPALDWFSYGLGSVPCLSQL